MRLFAVICIYKSVQSNCNINCNINCNSSFKLLIIMRARILRHAVQTKAIIEKNTIMLASIQKSLLMHFFNKRIMFWQLYKSRPQFNQKDFHKQQLIRVTLQPTKKACKRIFSMSASYSCLHFSTHDFAANGLGLFYISNALVWIIRVTII